MRVSAAFEHEAWEKKALAITAAHFAFDTIIPIGWTLPRNPLLPKPSQEVEEIIWIGLKEIRSAHGPEPNQPAGEDDRLEEKGTREGGSFSLSAE